MSRKSSITNIIGVGVVWLTHAHTWRGGYYGGITGWEGPLGMMGTWLQGIGAASLCGAVVSARHNPAVLIVRVCARHKSPRASVPVILPNHYVIRVRNIHDCITRMTCSTTSDPAPIHVFGPHPGWKCRSGPVHVWTMRNNKHTWYWSNCHRGR